MGTQLIKISLYLNTAMNGLGWNGGLSLQTRSTCETSKGPLPNSIFLYFLRSSVLWGCGRMHIHL